MIVWIASFPRSGNTFFRSLLHLVYGQATYSVYNDRLLVRIGMAPTLGQEVLPAHIDAMRADERLFFVKTHGHPNDDNPAIYLLRDGRDACVSLAHFLSEFWNAPLYARAAWRLIHQNAYRRKLDEIVRRGEWSRHVDAWTQRSGGTTYIVRYEELCREPERVAHAALAKVGVPLQPIGEPPTFASLHARWPTFFRRGRIGSWREEMPHDLHAAFWRRNRTTMLRCGYDEDMPPAIEARPPARRWMRFRTGWDLNLDRIHDGNAGNGAAESAASVSMSCLGRHGLWGNTICQYMFLKAFARQHGREAEVPEWLGQHLFAEADRPLTRRHDVVLRDNLSLLHEEANHLGSMFEFVSNRVRNLAERGRQAFVLNDPMLTGEPPELPAAHVDLEGLFMIHSRALAPHREYLRSLFRFGPTLEEHLGAARDRLRQRGRTIIGIHVRRGDFDHIYSGQGYEFVTPMRWYLEWLERVWKEADDPVLLVCSNNLRDVLPHFAKFNPITAASVGATMPDAYATLPVAVPWQRVTSYVPDWYLLQHCDLLAISNSTFSFSAAMLNARARTVVRPSLFVRRLNAFDPWNAQPVFFLPQRATMVGELGQRIRLAYDGLGARAILPGLRVAMRTYRDVLRRRARVCRLFFGSQGLRRELMQPAFYLAARRHYHTT